MSRTAHTVRTVAPVPPPASRASSRPRRGAVATALAAAAALVLAGCVGGKEQTTPRTSDPQPSGEPTVEPGGDLESFYGQSVDWSDCAAGFECATIAAPLDWDDPTAGAIELAIKRKPAQGGADQRIGSLLTNPGGPGASGLDFVTSAVDYVIGDPVLDAFDIVGFDPRGVGQSSPIDCGSDEFVDEFFTTDYPMASQADVEAARERVREFGETCLAETGALLGEVDTVSAARDMDLIRAVLGDDQLYYLGFSYGTFLGATYANLYPENVGRLVLDGAMDPSMTNDELVIGQAAGFENALRAYVEDCQRDASCPLTGTVEAGMAQVAEVVAAAEVDPLPAGSAEVNGTLAWYGVVVTLYSDENWPYLTWALDEAISQGTGETLLELANFYLDRTPEGAYTTNSMEVFNAINCLDYPMVERDYDEMAAFTEEIVAVAPTFGREFGMAVGCETWPMPPTGVRGEIRATGAAPILVVGTTGDPATPYEWAVALADQLDSAELLTWEGEGHTAYGRGGRCVSDVVESYLLEGVLPEGGARC